MRPAYPNFLDGMPKRSKPLFVQKRGASQWLTTIDKGQVRLLGVQHRTGLPQEIADRMLRLARRPKTRRVIIDLRNNGGGDINTYTRTCWTR